MDRNDLTLFKLFLKYYLNIKFLPSTGKFTHTFNS